MKLFRLDVPPERTHQFVAGLDALLDARLSHNSLTLPVAAGLSSVNAYLGQEFVAADSLDLVCRETGPLPTREFTRIVSALAGALDEAAGRGFAHGALHPRDVLVSPDDVRVTGIGIAQALDQIGVMPPLRRPYAAPERVAGQPWDRRADVFSLGVLAYEMLTGRRLAGTGDQALEHLDVADVNLAALREAFTQAIDDDPSQRFPTAGSLAEALARACESPARVRSPRRRSQNSEARSQSPEGARMGDEQPVDRELTLPLTSHERSAPERSDEELELQTSAADQDNVADFDATLRIEEPEVDALPTIRVAEMPTLRMSELPTLRVPGPAADEVGGSAEAATETAEAVILDATENATEVKSEESVAESADVIAASSAPEMGLRPLALALLLGLAIGFAGGYGVAYKARGSEQIAELKAIEPEVLPAVALAPADVPVATSSLAPRAVRSEPALSAPAAVAPAPHAVREPQASPKAAVSPKPPAAGRLLVRSTPSGARIIVDGRDSGRTPATLRNVGFGTHEVRLVRDGYGASEHRVVLTAAKPSPSISVNLTPVRKPAPAAKGGSGALGVDSRPVGANVFVDGRLVGTTPMSLDHLAPGDHVVHLEREGYQRWSSSVRIVSGEKNRVAASLENQD